MRQVALHTTLQVVLRISRKGQGKLKSCKYNIKLTSWLYTHPQWSQKDKKAMFHLINLSSGLMFTLTSILSLSLNCRQWLSERRWIRQRMRCCFEKHVTPTAGSMLFFNLQNERKILERQSFKKTESDLKVIT